MYLDELSALDSGHIISLNLPLSFLMDTGATVNIVVFSASSKVQFASRRVTVLEPPDLHLC